jgi:hypothetical protein
VEAVDFRLRFARLALRAERRGVRLPKLHRARRQPLTVAAWPYSSTPVVFNRSRAG